MRSGMESNILSSSRACTSCLYSSYLHVGRINVRASGKWTVRVGAKCYPKSLEYVIQVAGYLEIKKC